MKERASEAARIADQLRRAFDGSAWHGPALLELLKDVDAATAAAQPLADVHSIWELVLHIAVWDEAGLRRLSGEKWQPKGLANFPRVTTATEGPWRGCRIHACGIGVRGNGMIFIICCMGSRSMSFIMRGRLRF